MSDHRKNLTDAQRRVVVNDLHEVAMRALQGKEMRDIDIITVLFAKSMIQND